jgi:ankyrin repeat protein
VVIFTINESGQHLTHSSHSVVIFIANSSVNFQALFNKLGLTNAPHPCALSQRLQIPMGTDLEAETHQGQTPLLMFVDVRGDDIEELKAFIANNPSVNFDAVDSEGRTVLHYAADHGTEELIGLLLSEGVSREAKDKSGMTPLLCCVKSREEDEDNLTGPLGALIMAGAKQDAVDNEGWTILFHASATDKPQTLKMLLDMGIVNKDAQSADGTTALFHGGPATIRVLLQAGANMSIHNNEGYTAQDKIMHRIDDGGPDDEDWEFHSDCLAVFKKFSERRYAFAKITDEGFGMLWCRPEEALARCV